MTANLTGMTDIVAIILALSAASERLVTLVKGIRFLNSPRQNASEERFRVWLLRALSVIAGILTAFLASEFLFERPVSLLSVLGLGILASGGSDLWNSILGWLNAIKDDRKGDAAEAKQKLV